MLKKLFFIPCCLSLFFSPVAYSQQVSLNDLELVSQDIAKSIDELSIEEKTILKEILFETLETKNEAHDSTTAIVLGIAIPSLYAVGCLLFCIGSTLVFLKVRHEAKHKTELRDRKQERRDRIDAMKNPPVQTKIKSPTEN